jgi:predicted dehydrogenase
MPKVRMAILGCGNMAGWYAQRFAKHPGVELVALSDVSQEILDGFIERNLKDFEPKPQTFTDPAEMYQTARPDAVTIVTPHTLHFAHAMQALENGCHIIMEKPMVTDSTQAHELAMKVKETGKILVIGYNTPCTPAISYIRDAIRSGEFGKLELISGWLTQSWLKRQAGTWRQKPELSGGGQMYDSGAHIFNTLVWTVEQPVEAVHAFVDNMGTQVDINGTANIKFKSGVFATLTISGNCPANGSKMVYVFDNGCIECDGWLGSWVKAWKGSEEIADLGLDTSTTHSSDNFIDAILGRAEPRTSPLNGINQSEIMDAIYESARTGTVVKPKSHRAA